MLKKEKNMINLCNYVNGLEEIGADCKASIIVWIDHCYHLNKPQSRKDIDNLIAKAFDTTDDVDNLIPAVLEKAISKRLYSNLFLDWNLKYDKSV